MCRIIGCWDFKNNNPNNLAHEVKQMRDVLVHGGPDDSGLYVDHLAGLALGHRRLSIIDLTKTGQQPMTHPSGRWVICYNGEVYNFKQVKAELIQMGVVFNSTSDTEVILHAWVQWGQECLEKFRGMFAFAIWDKQEKQLTIVRDRMGVKPLYYYHHNNIFMFASELKAFHQHPLFKKELNQDAVASFMTYGYVQGDSSIFKNVYKLTPGTFLTINQNQNKNHTVFWSLPKYERPSSFNESDFLESLHEELKTSFNLRMVSDVPVGVFLSGGVDSSLLASILQSNSSNKINTFTIGFDDQRYDESDAAHKIAQYLGTEHHHLTCNLKDGLNIIPKLPETYDEPFGDTSAIPTSMVSKLASNHVKVVLSADGGDEQYAGYNRYKIYDFLNRVGKIPFTKQALTMANHIGCFKLMGMLNKDWVHFSHRFKKILAVLNAPSMAEKIALMSSPFQKSEYATSIPVSHRGIDQQSHSYLSWDMMNYLSDDILTKVDRATMAVSIEGREPFLDHKLIEKSFECPYEFKVKDGYRKYPLRKILARYLPAHLTNQPKKGFGVPIFEWLQDELFDEVIDTISNADLGLIECIQPEVLNELVNNYKDNNHAHHPLKIWYLFVFFRWCNKWLKTS